MNARLLFVCTVLALPVCFADAQTIRFDVVAPNDLEFVDGNSGSHWPWASGPMRYQQIFDASEFSSLTAAGGGWIRYFSFRLDAADIGDFQRGVGDVQINLSTTSRFPDGLSTVFAENIGADQRVVFTGDAILVMGREPGPGNTLAFGYPIYVDPFFYDPSQGNLLLDIQIFSEGPILLPSDMDSSRVLGDSISRVVGNVNASSGFTVDTEGLVTRFFVEPIPEPGILALLGVGTGIGTLVYRARRRR